MANYSLSVSSTFQPFSYQELALPIDRQDAYFEKLAEEYDKLSSQADILEAMGANDRDRRSGTYGRYKSYSDALRQEADNLYRNGLNSESRQRLSDLRRRYNTDIVPIQNAWNKREQEADMQLKASLQNPSIMFTRDARNTSLDDYIANPTGGFGVISGANITAQMSAMAKNLEKQVMSNNIENIDPFTYNHIQKFGLDENLIRNWQDSPTLKAMFEQVMRANGVTPEALSQSANMQDIINKSIGYAEMGMWNAMGTEKSEIKENWGARLNAQAAKELSVYRAKKDIDAEYADAAGAGGTGGNMIAINPLNIYSTKEIEEADSNYNNYKDYFTQKADGTYVINQKGLEAYKKTQGRAVPGMGYSQPGPSDFKNFLDAQNGGKELIPFADIKAGRANIMPRGTGALWSNYLEGRPQQNYDATRTTEFDYTIDSSQHKDIKRAIQTAARGTALEEVDFDSKTNTFKPTNKKLKLTDLDDDKYEVLATRFSPYGNTVMIKDDKGEVHRYRMPAGINTYNESNRDKAMQKAMQLQNVISTGRYTIGGVEYEATEEELREAERQYNEALQNAYLYHSQLGAANKTKEQEFNPYGY